MKFHHSLVLAALIMATSAFGQLIATGVQTGVVTVFDAEINGQDLFITVDNTYPVNGVTGSVTAFGFNTPWMADLDLDKVAVSYQLLSLTGPTTGWKSLSSFELTAGLGGGGVTVDLGLESDDNGNPNGNSANNGVDSGETVRFKFAFDALDYPMPISFIHDFFNQDANGPDFLVRWQDVEGSTAGTSDAFGGDWPIAIPQGGVEAVPEPSTYGLLGALGLILLVSIRKRRR